MNPSSFRQSEKYQLGHTGELLISNLLQERGWFVIPSYDYSGDDGNKAPRLEGLLKSYVLPDLDIAKNGSRKWAEVKTKSSSSFTKKTMQHEHGIPMRHFEDYRQIRGITGCEVWLFVYELDCGEVICAELDTLSQNRRVYEGHKMSNGGMVFFPRHIFRFFANIQNECRPAIHMHASS